MSKCSAIKQMQDLHAELEEYEEGLYKKSDLLPAKAEAIGRARVKLRAAIRDAESDLQNCQE